MIKLDDPRKATHTEIYDAMGDSPAKEWADKKSAELSWFFFKTYLVRLAVISFMVLVIFLKPDDQDIATWFARSGSILVVLAVISEIWLSRTQNEVFKENSFGLYCQLYVEKRFKTQAKWSQLFDLSVGVIGTVIWGYGDLIWVYFFRA